MSIQSRLGIADLTKPDLVSVFHSVAYFRSGRKKEKLGKGGSEDREEKRGEKRKEAPYVNQC